MKIPIDIRFLKWRLIGWLILTAYPVRNTSLQALRNYAEQNFPDQLEKYPKIALIKAMRSFYEIGLKEAKEYVELLLKQEEHDK